MSPKSAIAIDDAVFGWVKTVFMRMGTNQQLPCSVRDKVFLDFNSSQADKVFLVLTPSGEKYGGFILLPIVQK